MCAVKKVSKAILIAGALLVALAVALVAGLNMYVQSPGSQARIQEELSKLLRLPLKFTSLTVSPFGGLRVTGITIPNGDANFLEAASFDAHYRLLPLLQGKFIITEMSVDSPKVVLSQSPDGKWKLPEPEQAEKISREHPPTDTEKKPTEKKSAFSVLVERFDVKGGSVELFDKDGKHVAVLTNVNMTYTSVTPEHIAGRATIGKLIWADSFTLENVSSPFDYADGAFNLPEIVATFAGGTLKGNFHTHSEKSRSPYKLAVGFDRLDLDHLAPPNTPPEQRTEGLLSGQIELHGDTQDSDKLNGDGRIDLRNGQFHQLDLFQNIGQILGFRELADLRIRDGHGDFHVSGSKITVQKLTLNTSDLQFTAQGTAHLDKKLNLTAQISTEDSVYQRLPGMIREGFTPVEGGRHAVDFTITGSIDKPKSNLLEKLRGQTINTQLGGLLQGILGGGEKKADDKAQDKDRKKKDKDKGGQPPPSPSAATPFPVSPTPATTQPAAPNP